MPYARIIALTSPAMVAFAANSLLCRIALKHTSIVAASFTAVRLISGAAMLCLVERMKSANQTGTGIWLSAFALFAYAACFSFVYLHLSAGTGALFPFGAVQAAMIAYGVWAGEQVLKWPFVSTVIAIGRLVVLLPLGNSTEPSEMQFAQKCLWATAAACERMRWISAVLTVQRACQHAP